MAWCAKMEHIAWQKGLLIGEYEGAKAAVSKFMTIMEGGHSCSLYYEKQSEEILYVKDATTEKISSLSAGYGRDGTITSTDEEIEHDITVTLNLNETTSAANRQSAWAACKRVMQKQQKTGT